MAIHEQYEETKQSQIHTYCVVSDAPDDTYFAGCIVRQVNAAGADGQAELAVDASRMYAGVLHCPGRKAAFKKGQPIAVASTGIIKIIAGAGGILPGDPIKADANGKGVKAAAGDFIVGWARNTVNNAGECITTKMELGKI